MRAKGLEFSQDALVARGCGCEGVGGIFLELGVRGLRSKDEGIRVRRPGNKGQRFRDWGFGSRVGGEAELGSRAWMV